MENLVIFIFSYLIGSISPSYIIGKLVKNIDIREYGSGNPGTTNVIRVMGKEYAFIVFSIDFLKGFLTVFLVRSKLGLEVATISGIFIILGHIFSIFLNFKGGKGAASTIGIYLCLFPKIMIISCIICIILLMITKYVSLSSMMVTFLITPFMFIFDYNKEVAVYTVVYTILIFYSHRGNIKRLINGKERKLGEEK